ncbi:hypothetical protein ACIA49_28610 [Kribbella sp. NPDC051587]|uniref:hypothetical protein n=1 Tax=Kribbella sp. NPDC051587 TaxID=3364119 RepID=UPI0037AA21FB
MTTSNEAGRRVRTQCAAVTSSMELTSVAAQDWAPNKLPAGAEWLTMTAVAATASATEMSCDAAVSRADVVLTTGSLAVLLVTSPGQHATARVRTTRTLSTLSVLVLCAVVSMRV